MIKKKQEALLSVAHIPPKKEIHFFIGEKYYRRMQPTPYAYKKVNSKNVLKNLLDYIEIFNFDTYGHKNTHNSWF